MTGFGKQGIEIGGRAYQIEIRSVNSKQLDLNLKIPSVFRELEMEIRTYVSNMLIRGKIEVCIFSDKSKNESELCLNIDNLQRHYTDLQNAASILNIEMTKDVMASLLQMPNLYTSEVYEMTPEDLALMLDYVKTCVADFDVFRIEEGAALEKDLKHRVSLIREYVEKVEPFEVQRIETVRQNLSVGLERNLPNLNLDQNRLEQEIIYYIEKFDITEEKIRLNQHCEYFIQTMQEEVSGKKLAFIAQEMGREINTLGSKANHIEIQKIVVNMKDELEKIKEQLSNIL